VLGVSGASLDGGTGQLVFGLAASGPSFAALVMWLRRRAERSPGPRARWSFGALSIAVLVGAIAPVGTAVLLHLDDLAIIPRHAGSVIADIGGPLMALVYTFVAGPLAEEFGWRGYVQPRLRRVHGATVTTAVLGAAWGAWHLPLFFMPGTGQHDKGLFSQQGLAFFVTILPLTYLMLFVTETLRGGVPAAILTHAAWNLTDELMPPQGNGGLWLKVLLLTAAAGVVALLRPRAAPGPVGVQPATASFR
jgi:membrane protease YdiL (CAAX protease family)